MRIIMGNRDWAQFLAEDLGYYVDYVSEHQDMMYFLIN